MWLDALLIAVVVLQLALVVLVMAQSRRARQNPMHGQVGGGVPELLVINALNKLDHRMDALEERLKRLVEQGQRRDAEAPLPSAAAATLQDSSSTHHYELAQQLAREGGGVDALMERCGLSRNEAELVLHLYADRR